MLLAVLLAVLLVVLLVVLQDEVGLELQVRWRAAGLAAGDSWARAGAGAAGAVTCKHVVVRQAVAGLGLQVRWRAHTWWHCR
eukprot:COSAG02_NODE_412_length_22836_cov_41.209966_3_plen_82_part_00